MAIGTTLGVLELNFCLSYIRYGESRHFVALQIPIWTYLTKQNVLSRINSMTYDAVLSLNARIPAQLDRVWTQDPVMLEDALGRLMPFHLEFIDSWEVGHVN